MAGAWGCPHETNDTCSKVNHLPCDPGMKGCVLHGRYVFADDAKNRHLRQKQVKIQDDRPTPEPDDISGGGETKPG